MARKEVSQSNTISITKEIGKEYEGIYKGSKEIDSKMSSTGKQTIWQFIDNDGLLFSIYGFTNLDRAMEAIKPETLCYITYLGTQNLKTKFGMKDVHQVKVQIEVEDETQSQPESDKMPF